MIHYFRLLRPVNLFIVGLTIYVLACFFDVENGFKTVLSLNFFLIVFSIMLITGAGNVINDCFDLEIDKINKLDKVIIGKSISIEQARRFHFLLNLIALTLCFYVCYEIKNYSFLIVEGVTVVLLWFYSSRLKRALFLGNFLVAILTAVVPMLVVLFFSIVHSTVQFNLPAFGTNYEITQIGFFFSIFAFLLNFSREVIKDIEDIEGDRQFFGNTIPIKFGVAKGKIWALIPIILTLVFLSSILFSIDFLKVIPFLLVVIILAVTIFQFARSKEKNDFHKTGNILKLAMLIGVLTPLYWIFYG